MISDSSWNMAPQMVDSKQNLEKDTFLFCPGQCIWPGHAK